MWSFRAVRSLSTVARISNSLSSPPTIFPPPDVLQRRRTENCKSSIGDRWIFIEVETLLKHRTSNGLRAGDDAVGWMVAREWVTRQLPAAALADSTGTSNGADDAPWSSWKTTACLLRDSPRRGSRGETLSASLYYARRIFHETCVMGTYDRGLPNEIVMRASPPNWFMLLSMNFVGARNSVLRHQPRYLKLLLRMEFPRVANSFARRSGWWRKMRSVNYYNKVACRFGIVFQGFFRFGFYVWSTSIRMEERYEHREPFRSNKRWKLHGERLLLSHAASFLFWKIHSVSPEYIILYTVWHHWRAQDRQAFSGSSKKKRVIPYRTVASATSLTRPLFFFHSFAAFLDTARFLNCPATFLCLCLCLRLSLFNLPGHLHPRYLASRLDGY